MVNIGADVPLNAQGYRLLSGCCFCQDYPGISAEHRFNPRLYEKIEPNHEPRAPNSESRPLSSDGFGAFAVVGFGVVFARFVVEFAVRAVFL